MDRGRVIRRYELAHTERYFVQPLLSLPLRAGRGWTTAPYSTASCGSPVPERPGGTRPSGTVRGPRRAPVQPADLTGARPDTAGDPRPGGQGRRCRRIRTGRLGPGPCSPARRRGAKRGRRLRRSPGVTFESTPRRSRHPAGAQSCATANALTVLRIEDAGDRGLSSGKPTRGPSAQAAPLIADEGRQRFRIAKDQNRPETVGGCAPGR